jgi:mRNA degradation ribonuclease J1/J2
MEIKPTKELQKSAKDLVERFQNRWSLLNLQTDFDRLHSLKEKAKELGKQIAETVKSVNKMSIQEQTRQLQELAPELLEKKGPCLGFIVLSALSSLKSPIVFDSFPLIITFSQFNTNISFP